MPAEYSVEVDTPFDLAFAEQVFGGHDNDGHGDDSDDDDDSVDLAFAEQVVMIS